MDQGEIKEKQRYALALIRLVDPYKAALDITGGDQERSLIISRDWPSDPVVVSKQVEEVKAPTTYQGVLAKVNEVGFELLTKAEKIVYIKQNLVLQAESLQNKGRDAIAALKLLAEIEGLTNVGNSGVVNNTQVNNYRVMKYKDHGTNEEWEASLIKQQAKLIDAATVN